MPSRKRNKGKERKAKKEAAANLQSTLQKRMSQTFWWNNWVEVSRCTHGCVVPPPDHAVAGFMNTFVEAWNGESAFEEDWDQNNVNDALEATFEKHPDVWNDEVHRQMAIGVLLRMGTNMILKSEDDYDIDIARRIGIIIVILDGYDGNGSYQHAANVAMVKGVIFAAGNERDILKFYSKRLSCSCLTEKYKQARKALPKIGQCFHCRQSKERSHLMTCGRCKVPFYCSRECQVANVPMHKEACRACVDYKKRQEDFLLSPIRMQRPLT